MKGLFIPEITTEMFRNGCLESIEALMAEGEIYDIDYQQPCEDCISRDAVEKITWEEPSYDDALNVLTEVRDKVRALPSVKPQRPSKNWIHWTDDYKDYVTCPSCGYGEEGEVLLSDKTPFCPICGADMREGAE